MHQTLQTRLQRFYFVNGFLLHEALLGGGFISLAVSSQQCRRRVFGCNRRSHKRQNCRCWIQVSVSNFRSPDSSVFQRSTLESVNVAARASRCLNCNTCVGSPDSSNATSSIFSSDKALAGFLLREEGQAHSGLDTSIRGRSRPQRTTSRMPFVSG